MSKLKIAPILNSILLFAILSACFIPSSVALAASSKAKTEISGVAADPIKETTVNLFCRLKAGKKTYAVSGSGSFISERGVILTNAHVAQYFLLAGEKGRVTGTCNVRTGSPAKTTFTASILYIPVVWLEENISKISQKEPGGTGENDFALLNVTGTKKGDVPAQFPFLPVSSGASTSMPVTVAGYPTEGLDFKEITKKLELLTATSTITNIQSFDRDAVADILTLAPSAAASTGVSGGPIVNSATSTLGIITSKSSAKDSLTLRGISISYIDRSIYGETNMSLSSMLAGDFAAIASTTSASISNELRQDLANGLRKRK